MYQLYLSRYIRPCHKTVVREWNRSCPRVVSLEWLWMCEKRLWTKQKRPHSHRFRVLLTRGAAGMSPFLCFSMKVMTCSE